MSTYDQHLSSPGKQDQNPGQAGKEPSGDEGNNPSTAGPGNTHVTSNTPENAAGTVNPSPEDSNVTPGSIPENID